MRYVVIITGDSNVHSPIWGEDQVKTDSMTDDLQDIIATYDLDLFNTKGTITWRQRRKKTQILQYRPNPMLSITSKQENRLGSKIQNN